MVEIKGLSKVFTNGRKGEVWALRDITFSAHPGEIYGLLGPNGAGKTTTLRIISTLLTPTQGEVRIAGFDVLTQPDKVRGLIGFLTGETGLYPRLSAKELLEYFGSLYHLQKERLNRRIEELGSLLEMTSFWHRKCAHLSTGEQQRVNIARTMLHDPPVIILDEPTAGLDVLASRNIVEFIRQAKRTGKCIILSTHDMGEAERLCDRVGIIHQGMIVAEGSPEQLLAHYRARNLEEVFLSAIPS